MGPQVRKPLLFCAPFAIALDRRSNRIQHILIAKRLGQKIDCSSLHGFDRHGDVAMAGHEYDGDVNGGFGQLGLEVEAAQPGQSDVEHQTARHVRKLGSQQLRG